MTCRLFYCYCCYCQLACAKALILNNNFCAGGLDAVASYKHETLARFAYATYRLKVNARLYLESPVPSSSDASTAICFRLLSKIRRTAQIWRGVVWPVDDHCQLVWFVLLCFDSCARFVKLTPQFSLFFAQKLPTNWRLTDWLADWLTDWLTAKLDSKKLVCVCV